MQLEINLIKEMLRVAAVAPFVRVSPQCVRGSCASQAGEKQSRRGGESNSSATRLRCFFPFKVAGY